MPRRCESQPVAKDGFTVCESVPILRLIYLALCESVPVLESLEEVPEGALKSKGLLRVRVRVRVCVRVRIRMRVRVPVRVRVRACARVCVYVCVCVACPETDQFATSNINTNNQ